MHHNLSLQWFLLIQECLWQLDTGSCVQDWLAIGNKIDVIPRKGQHRVRVSVVGPGDIDCHVQICHLQIVS
jgi:hypothetical protein